MKIEYYFDGFLDDVRLYNRVLDAVEVNTLAGYHYEGFVYDHLGNRMTANTNGGDVAYAHNAANEYTSIGGTNVYYDAVGNLSKDADGYQYFYDYENRLQEIKDSSENLKAKFTYDALGRRIEKIEYATPANITTRYYYDGWRVLAETDAADTTQREYVYGNYLDEVLVMVDSSSNDHYYAHDHLFSVVALIADDGSIEERYEYDAYGKVIVSDDDFSNPRATSSYDNPYTFTGQRLDSLDNNSLTVMYYKNRYYDTDTGRFLQRDPLGIQDEICLVNYTKTGAPVFPRQLSADNQYIDGMCLYQYVQDNPVISFDSFGNVMGSSFSYFLNRGIACCKYKKKEIIFSEEGIIFSKGCGQTEVLNPKGFNPMGACKCALEKDNNRRSKIKVYDAHYGPCCWCSVYFGEDKTSTESDKDAKEENWIGRQKHHGFIWIRCHSKHATKIAWDPSEGPGGLGFPKPEVRRETDVYLRNYYIYPRCDISCAAAEKLRNEYSNREIYFFLLSNCRDIAERNIPKICRMCP